MSKKIERSVDGVVDYCIDKVEQIDERDDLDIEKKNRQVQGFLKEARAWATMNVGFKKLMIQAPDIANNRAIMMPIGSPQIKAVNQEEEPTKQAAG
jgi:hypothetical protein